MPGLGDYCILPLQPRLHVACDLDQGPPYPSARQLKRHQRRQVSYAPGALHIRLEPNAKIPFAALLA